MIAREDGTRGELHSKELHPRELETLRLLSQGYTFKEIAVFMGIQWQTIKNRLTVVRSKLGARNTIHAVAIAKDRGLI